MSTWQGRIFGANVIWSSCVGVKGTLSRLGPASLSLQFYLFLRAKDYSYLVSIPQIHDLLYVIVLIELQSL